MYCNYVKTKLVRIGNSKGIRIPRELLQVYGLAEGDEIELEQRHDGVFLKPAARGVGRLSYVVQYERMAEEAAETAEWREWDGTAGDGFEY